MSETTVPKNKTIAELNAEFDGLLEQMKTEMMDAIAARVNKDLSAQDADYLINRIEDLRDSDDPAWSCSFY